ncbi:MAG: hypothetical protein JXQ73_31420 [Phycisphaerae bacterium]|nr:hypothetical protein [Phycisphaerae bacterium]
MTGSSSSVGSGSDVTLPVLKRRRWPSVLLGVVLLVSGGAIGSGVTVLVIAHKVKEHLHHPERAPAEATAYLRWRFDLTDQQAQSVETVLRKRRQEILKIRRGFQPRLEGQIDLIGEEVGALLNPDQAKEWQAWLAEKRESWLPPLPDIVETAESRPSS